METKLPRKELVTAIKSFNTILREQNLEPIKINGVMRKRLLSVFHERIIFLNNVGKEEYLTDGAAIPVLTALRLFCLTESRQS